MTGSPRPGHSLPAGARRVYRRSTGSRLVGSASALLFFGGALSAATAGATLACLVLIGLSAISLVNLVGVWADRYVLDDAGIEYGNLLLLRLGVRPRRAAWEEIRDVREVRPLRRGREEGPPTALFLTLRSGRRMVLDSIEGFSELMESVRARLPGDGPPG